MVTEATLPLALKIGPHKVEFTFFLSRDLVLVACSIDATFVGLFSNLVTHPHNSMRVISNTVAHSLDPMGTSSNLVAHSPDLMGTGSNPVDHSLDRMGTSSNPIFHSPVSMWSLTSRYKDFLDAFEIKNADQLLKHQ